MSKMGISTIDRKILWAKAGNRCSYHFEGNNCDKELINSQDKEKTVIAEEAHIVGPKKGSPRYIENFPNVDNYENRILLCRDCHKKIDTHEEIYTIEVIHKMKKEHEKSIANRLSKKESEMIRCRSCGVKVKNTKEVKIIWDENQHGFLVFIECFCKPCNLNWSTDIIKYLKFEVSKDSYCDCGGSLNLKEYFINEEEYKLKFFGIYICEKCNKEERIIVPNLISKIKKKWRTNDKILFDNQGISFLK